MDRARRNDVKFSMDPEKYTQKRADTNVSIRKQKRENKLGNRRNYAPASLESNYRLVDTHFQAIVNDDLVKATHVAYGNMCRQEVTNSLIGLQQMHFLVSSAAEHNTFVVHRTLPKVEFSQKLCFFLKTERNELQEHVFNASLVLTQLIVVRKESDSEEKQWAHAFLGTELFPAILSHHLLNNPNWEIRDQMFHVVNNFVMVHRENAERANMSPTMVTLSRQSTDMRVRAHILWYMYSMLTHHPGLPWKEHGEPFWDFFEVCLKNVTDKFMIYDCMNTLFACYGRGTIMVETVRRVGLDRFMQLLARSDVAGPTLSIVCRLDDPELLTQCFVSYAPLLLNLFKTKKYRKDMAYMCYKLSKTNETNIFRLIRGNFVETMAETLDTMSPDRDVLRWEIVFINNVIAHAIRHAFKDHTCFNHIFGSGFLIWNLCEQLKFPDPARRVSILEIILHAIIWEDGMCDHRCISIRNLLMDKDYHTYISEIQYKDDNYEVSQAATQIIEEFEKQTDEMDTREVEVFDF